MKPANAWYLHLGQRHLWHCTCGHRTSLADPPILRRHHPRFRCPRCGNGRFLDAVEFRHNSKVLYWSPFVWEYRGKYRAREGWSVRAVIEVPYFHFGGQELRFETIDLARYILTKDGEYRFEAGNEALMRRSIVEKGTRILPIKRRMEEELPLLLLQLVARSPGPLQWLWEEKRFERSEPKTQREALALFLRFPRLREFDFFHWERLEEWEEELSEEPTVLGTLERLTGRQPRSVRRALFASYARAMERGRYRPLYDTLLCRHIHDPNHLSRLLAVDPQIKAELFGDFARWEAEEFLRLLSRFYDPKRMVRFFDTLDPRALRRHPLIDSYRMLRTPALLNRLLEQSPRLPADAAGLHRELITHYRRQRILNTDQVLFDYREGDRKACGIFEALEFRLPQNSYELERWARELSNCMFGYRNAIAAGRSLIYGIFVDDRLRYAVEIANGRITQALGRFNRPLPEEHRQEVERWFTELWRVERIRGEKNETS